MSDNEFASTPRSRAALARMEAQERAEYEARRKAKIDAGLDPGEPRKPPPTGRGRQPANGNFEPAPALEPQPYLSALATAVQAGRRRGAREIEALLGAGRPG